MIEVNLVPDVKRELLKAQKVRNLITTVSVIAGLVSIGITGLLAFTVYVGQAALSARADNQIQSQFRTFSEQDNVTQVLTVQNQLEQLASLDDGRYIASRIFGILEVVMPTGRNSISISELRYDKDIQTISIEGHALNGFVALETLQKTIEQTTFVYADSDEPQDLIFGPVVITEQSMGEDSDGRLVLRFSLSFTIDETVLLASSKSVRIIGPDRQNVTDSRLQIPDNIFAARATDTEEEDQ